jgi:glycosyltransferase involved in cell wall biosynthesis
MEAMSFGIPVIATAVGGTPEIVEHKYNGLLMRPTPTQQEVKKAIEFFHAMDDEQYRKYCSNAYQTWIEKYNANKNYQNFIDEIIKLG